MEKLHGFTQWQLLFHKAISQAYEQEPVYQLKTISMLNCALNREIEKLRDAFNVKGPIGNDLPSIIFSQEKCDKTSFANVVLSHNTSIKNDSVQCANVVDKTRPDIKTSSFEISDDELFIDSSPEIKKKQRKQRHSPTLKKVGKRRKILLENIINQPCRSEGNGNVQKEEDKRADTLEGSADKTPQKTVGDFDSFIIDSTPVSKEELGKKKKSFSTNHKENSTLTQMFSIKAQSKMAKKCKKAIKQSFDSRETFLNTNIDNYTSLDKLNNENMTNNVASVNVILDDPDVTEDISLVFTEEKSSEKTVKKWSCEECDKVYSFYSKQGLYSINRVGTYRCSKHRCTLLREDTIPGFWDMDVKTQDNENA